MVCLGWMDGWCCFQPKRWWCFFPWDSSSSSFVSFFSWCSWKANPPAPTAAAAAISSSILCLWACSGSFFSLCFSCWIISLSGKTRKTLALLLLKMLINLKQNLCHTTDVIYIYIYIYILLPRHKHQLRQHPSRQAARDACGASLPSCSQPQTRWR